MEELLQRQDVVTVEELTGGIFLVTDDVGDEMEGDLSTIIAWLDAGL